MQPSSTGLLQRAINHAGIVCWSQRITVHIVYNDTPREQLSVDTAAMCCMQSYTHALCTFSYCKYKYDVAIEQCCIEHESVALDAEMPLWWRQLRNHHTSFGQIACRHSEKMIKVWESDLALCTSPIRFRDVKECLQSFSLCPTISMYKTQGWNSLNWRRFPASQSYPC